jgi:hypothetical protein
VSAADAREELEAIVWRTRAVDQHAIIGILAAADRYATAAADEQLDAYVNEGIRAARARDRRDALSRAVADRTGIYPAPEPPVRIGRPS